MFMGKLKKHSRIIWEWYLYERDLKYPSSRTINTLKWYARKDKSKDYEYTGDWKATMEYACDRMNGGRARAILRLIKQAKEKQ